MDDIIDLFADNKTAKSVVSINDKSVGSKTNTCSVPVCADSSIDRGTSFVEGTPMPNSASNQSMFSAPVTFDVLFNDPAAVITLKKSVLKSHTMRRDSERGILLYYWAAQRLDVDNYDDFAALTRNKYYILSQKASDDVELVEPQKPDVWNMVGTPDVLKPTTPTVGEKWMSVKESERQTKLWMEKHKRPEDGSPRTQEVKDHFDYAKTLYEEPRLKEWFGDYSDMITEPVPPLPVTTSVAPKKLHRVGKSEKKPTTMKTPAKKQPRETVNPAATEQQKRYAVKRVVSRLCRNPSSAVTMLLAWMQRNRFRTYFVEQVRVAVLTQVWMAGLCHADDPIFWACLYPEADKDTVMTILDILDDRTEYEQRLVKGGEWNRGHGKPDGYAEALALARNKTLHALFGNTTTVLSTTSDQGSGLIFDITCFHAIPPPASTLDTMTTEWKLILTDGEPDSYCSVEVVIAVGPGAWSYLQGWDFVPYPSVGSSTSTTQIVPYVGMFVRRWSRDLHCGAHAVISASVPLVRDLPYDSEVAVIARIYAWSGRGHININTQYVPVLPSALLRYGLDDDGTYVSQRRLTPSWTIIDLPNVPVVSVWSEEIVKGGPITLTPLPLTKTDSTMPVKSTPPLSFGFSSYQGALATVGAGLLAWGWDKLTSGAGHSLFTVFITDYAVEVGDINPLPWVSTHLWELPTIFRPQPLAYTDGSYTGSPRTGQFINIVWLADIQSTSVTYLIDVKGSTLFFSDLTSSQLLNYTEGSGASKVRAMMWNKLMHSLNGNIDNLKDADYHCSMEEVMNQPGLPFDPRARAERYLGNGVSALSAVDRPVLWMANVTGKVPDAVATTRSMPPIVCSYQPVQHFTGVLQNTNAGPMPTVLGVALQGPPKEAGSVELTLEAIEQLKVWVANTSFASRPGSNTPVGIQMASAYQIASVSSGVGWCPEDWSLKLHLLLHHRAETLVNGRPKFGIWAGAYGIRDDIAINNYIGWVPQPVDAAGFPAATTNSNGLGRTHPVDWPQQGGLNGTMRVTLDNQWLAANEGEAVLTTAALFGRIPTGKVLAMLCLMMSNHPLMSMLATTIQAIDGAVGNTFSFYHNSMNVHIRGFDSIVFILPSTTQNLPQVVAGAAPNWAPYFGVDVPLDGAGAPVPIAVPGGDQPVDMTVFVASWWDDISLNDWILLIGTIWEHVDFHGVFDSMYPLAMSLIYQLDPPRFASIAETQPAAGGGAMQQDANAWAEHHPTLLGIAREPVGAANWPVDVEDTPNAWVYSADVRSWNLAMLRWRATTLRYSPGESVTLKLYSDRAGSIIHAMNAQDIARAACTLYMQYGAQTTWWNRLFEDDQIVTAGSIDMARSIVSTAVGCIGSETLTGTDGLWQCLLKFVTGQAWPLCGSVVTTQDALAVTSVVKLSSISRNMITRRTRWTLARRAANIGQPCDAIPCMMPDYVYYLPIPKVPKVWGPYVFANQSMRGEVRLETGPLKNIAPALTAFPYGDGNDPTNVWDESQFVDMKQTDYWNRRVAWWLRANGANVTFMTDGAAYANYALASFALWRIPGLLAAQDVNVFILGFQGSTLCVGLADDSLRPTCVTPGAGVAGQYDLVNQYITGRGLVIRTTVIPKSVVRATPSYPAKVASARPARFGQKNALGGGEKPKVQTLLGDQQNLDKQG